MNSPGLPQRSQKMYNVWPALLRQRHWCGTAFQNSSRMRFIMLVTVMLVVVGVLVSMAVTVLVLRLS